MSDVAYITFAAARRDLPVHTSALLKQSASAADHLSEEMEEAISDYDREAGPFDPSEADGSGADARERIRPRRGARSAAC